MSGKGSTGGQRSGRTGSTSSAPKAPKREYELVSPTTPEGQVTIGNIRSLLQEAIQPLVTDIADLKQKLDDIGAAEKKSEIT